jgi:hypothetical protein
MVHTGRAESLRPSRCDEPRVLVVVPTAAEPADGALREWCEKLAHPPGRLADGECRCGLIRYDE